MAQLQRAVGEAGTQAGGLAVGGADGRGRRAASLCKAGEMQSSQTAGTVATLAAAAWREASAPLLRGPYRPRGGCSLTHQDSLEGVGAQRLASGIGISQGLGKGLWTGRPGEGGRVCESRRGCAGRHQYEMQMQGSVQRLTPRQVGRQRLTSERAPAAGTCGRRCGGTRPAAPLTALLGRKTVPAKSSPRAATMSGNCSSSPGEEANRLERCGCGGSGGTAWHLLTPCKVSFRFLPGPFARCALPCGAARSVKYLTAQGAAYLASSRQQRAQLGGGANCLDNRRLGAGKCQHQQQGNALDVHHGGGGLQARGRFRSALQVRPMPAAEADAAKTPHPAQMGLPQSKGALVRRESAAGWRNTWWGGAIAGMQWPQTSPIPQPREAQAHLKSCDGVGGGILEKNEDCRPKWWRPGEEGRGWRNACCVLC